MTETIGIHCLTPPDGLRTFEPAKSCMTMPDVMIGEMPSSMSVPRLEARITRIQYLSRCLGVFSVVSRVFHCVLWRFREFQVVFRVFSVVFRVFYGVLGCSGCFGAF